MISLNTLFYFLQKSRKNSPNEAAEFLHTISHGILSHFQRSAPVKYRISTMGHIVKSVKHAIAETEKLIRPRSVVPPMRRLYKTFRKTQPKEKETSTPHL